MPLRKKLLIAALILGVVLSAVAIFILPTQYSVPILMYHSIKENPGDQLSVSPQNFEKQMNFLHKNKYKVISFRELVNYLRSDQTLSPKTVVITLDDGYEDNYLYAFPVLKNNNLPATIFLISDYVERDNYLTWPQIEEMADNRIEIGSHSKTHPDLNKLNDPKLLGEEILGSKKNIEARISRPVNSFCYPFGSMNDLVKEAVIKAGYSGAGLTHKRRRYDKNDVYALSRIKITNTDNLFVFWVKTSGYYTLFKRKK